jgi:hypothetical protein
MLITISQFYPNPSTVTMSFLFGGAPKMTSEQKIAAAETEVEMISDMFNRCVSYVLYLPFVHRLHILHFR